jgi:hypothetical protein
MAHGRHTGKKAADGYSLRHRLNINPNNRLSAAALAFLITAAGASRTGIKIQTAIEFEAVHMKINFDGLRFFEKGFVNDILVPVDFVFLVCIIGLIQSHGQAGTASTAFVEKNPDGLHLFVAEIRGDLLSGRGRNF